MQRCTGGRSTRGPARRSLVSDFMVRTGGRRSGRRCPNRCAEHPARARDWRLPLLLAAAVLVGGCDLGPSAPLRIGMLVWPPYELAFLAREQGYYDGTAIELVDYESPAVALRAYRDGVIDAVAVTIDYLLELAAQGPTHRVILVIDASHGGDALVAAAGFESLEGLKGRRIGVEASALGAYVLHRALEKGGLVPADIQRVPVDIPDQERALLAGEVDAVVTYEPVRGRLIARGARELFSSRDIPGEIVDVLVTRSSVLEERREQVDAFVRGWLRAREHLAAKPRQAAAVMAVREGIDADAMLDALSQAKIYGLEDNLRLLAGEAPGLLPVLRRHVESMRRIGTLQGPLDPTGLIDPRPVLRMAR